MTWTNIQIPEQHDIKKEQAEVIASLKFEIERKNNLINFLYRELENIFESLKQNGEVKISYRRETIIAKLHEVDDENQES